MLGYLGGVNWAILVAKVCKDNPDAAPNQLIHKFFTFYRDFDWVNNPIALDGILNDPEIVQFKLPDKTLEHLWQ